MHYLAVGRLVGNIDSDRSAFLQAQKRTRHLAVVGNGLDGSAGSDLKIISGNVEGVVSGSRLLGEPGQRR